MPEGPEVKRITENLCNFIGGETITSIDIMSGRYVSHGPPKGFESFVRCLPTRVMNVECKGKFIYITFDNGYSMWNTLGMAGSWSPVPTKHSRVKLNFKDGAAYFNDIRNFGTIRVTSNPSDLTDKLSELGPDMLSESVTDAVFKERIFKNGLNEKVNIKMQW